jgi:hypothetical protein
MSEYSDEDRAKVEKLRKSYPVMDWSEVLLRQAVVVTREGQEIEFFNDEKDAGAWMQHVYGVTPAEGKKEGIEIKRIADRGPKAGDMLIYLNDGEWYSHGIGILDHSYGKESLAVTFDASCFRVGEQVSNSGGPVPPVDPADLTFDGLRRNHFWRWNKGYAGGGEGGTYSINTPSWRWNGKRV